MVRTEQMMNYQIRHVKNLLLITMLALSGALSAQRDINHWQFSAIGGGFYFDENLSESLESIDAPGFYTIGLRIQKKLRNDFQFGVSFLENRLIDNTDFSIRLTDLHLSYNWDNGYLLSQRSVLSPYHLLAAGFRFRGSNDELNFENTRGLLSLENGIKVRLGDNWSTQVGFVINWNSRDESFDEVFDSGYNYGGVVGISYHLGSVKTTYNGPVFNAGRDFVGLSMDTKDFEESNAAVNGDDQHREALSPIQEESAPKTETEELIEKQNRLIQNQNEFIRMMLSGENYSELDSSMVLMIHGADPAFVETDNEPFESTTVQNEEFYDKRDSAAMMRIAKVDSAHVTQWKDAVIVQDKDTIYIIQNADSVKFAAMESRLKQLEEENESLKQEREMVNSDENSAEKDFVEEAENTEQIDQLEKRLNQLEEENENLKDNGKANSDNSEVKSASSESDQALLEETKRRNDLLEQQVAATQKLAEKSVEPTQVVIEEKKSNDRGGVNLTPGVVVPIGGGGGRDKRDNKEILENQEEMQSRLDSLTRVVAKLKSSEVTAPDSNGEINQGQNNTVVISESGNARTDTTKSDSLAMDTMATDSLARDTLTADTLTVDSLSQIDNVQPFDSTGVDTLKTNANFVLPPETLKNPNLQPGIVEELDSFTAQTGNDTIREQSGSKLESLLEEPKLEYPISVYFALNSVSLSPEDEGKLKEVAKDLATSLDRDIILEGHTDKSGNASYNEMLSKKRANTVRDFLTQNGVSESRITITPLGSQKADQSYNENSRRVDILVVSP